MYHCEAKAISRSDGRSAAGVCAYVSCSTARDVASGREFDFTRKGGLLETGFAGTAHRTPSSFAEALDGAEKRVNSCTAREVIVSLPDSITPAQRSALAERIAEDMAQTWDLPVMWAVHKPALDGDDRNHHVHYVLGTRDRAGKKVRAWNGADGRVTVDQLRSMVSERIQASVPEEERPLWDHRSYAARGIEVPAMMHEGNFATRLKRRWDVELDTVKANNELRAKAAELEQVSTEFHEHIQLEAARAAERADRAIDAANHHSDSQTAGGNSGAGRAQQGPPTGSLGANHSAGRGQDSTGSIGRIRDLLARIARATRLSAKNRLREMGRSDGDMAPEHRARGGELLATTQQHPSFAGALAAGAPEHRQPDRSSEGQGDAAIKWYASITDVIRAGLAEGRIPKGYVEAFTKYARATTFNERFMSQVPDPDKWTVQRERDGRIEYSPDWDKMLCEMMPPLITGPAKPTNKQPGRRL